MKKILLLIAIIISGMGLFAQEEITIGNGTGSSYNAPFNNYYRHSWNETIYQKDDIGEACLINTIAYHRANNYSYSTNTIKIYMGETDRNNISSTTDWTPMSSLTLVYSGSNVIIGDSEWETFVLDVPFEYSGESNLVVVVAKTANNYTNSLNWYYTSNPNGYNVSMYRQDDNSTSYSEHPSSNSGTRLSYAANIKLGVEELSQYSTTIDYENYSLKFIITDDELAECRVKCSTYPTVETSISIPSTVTISGINYNVTSIANSAFYNSDYITSIEIPNTVTSIGTNAFNDCDALSNVDLSNALTSIGSKAFYDCDALSSIELPNALTSIGEYAFYSCSILSDIEIPASVTTIGNYAFYYCTKLGGVTFAENSQLATIGNYAFAGNSSNYMQFTSIEIPSSVTSIGNYAFQYCTKLANITFEENSQLASIGQYAFQNCTSLTNIELPSTLTSISGYAFYNCTKLLSIRCFAEAVPTTASTAFNNAPSNMSIQVPENSVDLYKAASPWNNYKVTKMYDAIAGDNITIDYGNYSLKFTIVGFEPIVCEVLCTTKPSSATAITIPSSVTISGMECDVTALANDAFKYGYWYITDVEIPNTVTRIGNYAFYHCYDMASIEIPESVTTIGQYAFSSCSDLTNVKIPNSVTSIGNYAFQYCSNLDTLTFEENSQLAAISQYAFSNCSDLTNVEIPNSVTSIGNNAFQSCSDLDTLTFEGNSQLATIGQYAFSNCSNLTSIEIPSSVTSIGSYAFRYCKKLETVIFEENSQLKTIGEYAFAGDWQNDNYMQLRTIEIPSTVTSIGNYAFYYCSNLSGIRCYAENVPTAYNSTFSGTPSKMNIQVPENSVEAYKAASYWKNFNITALYPVFIGEYAIVDYENYSLKFTITNFETKECEVTCSTMPTTNISITIPTTATISGYEFNVTSLGENAFYDCDYLTDVELPNTLTSIGNNAFQYCNGLKNIEIPASVVSIGNSAFYNNNLENVTFSENSQLEIIGNHAFAYCYNFANIEIPNYVTTIGNSAFRNCKITKIEIPASVTSIGSYAFSDCSTLYGIRCHATEVPTTDVTAFNGVPATMSIQVPEQSVDSYQATEPWSNYKITKFYTIEAGDYAIVDYENYSLKYTVIGVEPMECDVVCSTKPTVDTEITIPATASISGVECTVTAIGRNAFSNCYNLKAIEMPNTITRIESSAFYYCRYMNDIEIPDAVTTIGGSAFYECDGLTNVELPNSLTTIAGSAFAYCDGLTSIEIPSSVTSISYNTFQNCSNLETIIVESGNTVYDSRNNCNAIIETANNNLLAGCKNTIIPNTVTSIGENAFHNCNSLTSIEIPNSVTSINNGAFEYCGNLTSIEIPNSVTYIGSFAFYNCDALSNVTFESNSQLTTIEDQAFSDCEILTSIAIPSSVTYICENAFIYTKLESISVESGNTAYDSRNGCNAIIETSNNRMIIGCKNSSIPNTVQSIAYSAFQYCEGLTDIFIPNSVTSIDNGAFNGCRDLESIVVEEDNPYYDSRNDCNAIIYNPEYYYDDDVTLIKGCKNTVIPTSVTRIDTYAFYESDLTEITIPASVEYIGNDAFAYCYELEKAYCFGETVKEADYNVFYDCWNLTIYVPEYLVSEYQSTFPWNEYNIEAISLEEESVTIDYDSYELTFTVTNINTAECNVYCSECPDESTEIIIPSTVTISDIEFQVTYINNYAFEYCYNLTSIEIPASVDYIDYYAFYDCSNLEKIYCYAESVPETYSEDPFQNTSDNLIIYVPEESLDNYQQSYPWYDYTIKPIPGPDYGEEKIINYEDYSLRFVVINTYPYECEVSLADNGNSSYDDIVIPSGITIRGYSCKVTTIAGQGFGWSYVSSVKLPNTITNIEYEAFYACNNLTSIKIPSSVISIDNSAFRYCSNLETIEVQGGNTVYDSRNNCNAIIETENNKLIAGCKTSLIPNSVTSIGEYAFYDCDNLTSLVFDANSQLATIDYHAFYDCDNLTSIEFPNTLTIIDDYAFYSCDKLEEISFGESSQLATIDSQAFAYCSSLTEIEIPNSVTSISGDSFSNCSNLETITVASENTVYDSRNECNAIVATETNTLILGCKNTVIPNTVTAIGDYAFYNCDAITDMEIPNSVTTLGSQAFRDCDNLTSVDIPSSVTSLGSQAFYSCDKLESITFAENSELESIDNSAFADCSLLLNVILPSSITSIGENVFSNCSKLYGIRCLAEEVPTTAINAFNTIPYHTNIQVPEQSVEMYKATLPWSNYNITKIYSSMPGEYAIVDYGNYSLKFSIIGFEPAECDVVCNIKPTANTEIEIPTTATISDAEYTVVALGNKAFLSCSYLTGIEMPENIKTIGHNAFESCSKLTSIEIPDNVTYIGNSAFRYTSLKNVEISNNVTYLGEYAFQNCNQLSEITFEENSQLTEIKSNTFAYCDALTSIEIPTSVTHIRNNAFYDCDGFVDFELHDSIAYIGSWAFEYCDNLENVYSYNLTPATIEWGAFSSINSSAKIYVPSESLDEYKSQWSNYQDIIVGFVTYSESGWTSIPVPTDYAYVDYPLVISENDTLSVYSLYISNNGAVTVEDGGQLICHKTRGDVTVEKEISGHLADEDNKWHTISSPLKNDIDLSSSSETNITSNSYELYRYDEPTHSMQAYNNGDFSTLETGRAYVYANSNDVTLSFTGNINSKDVEYNLTKESEEFAGFNMVANPFTHDITIDNFILKGNTMKVTFELTDSFGDGWNGCALMVSSQNGLNETYTISSGRNASYDLEINTYDNVTIKWRSGNYQNECSFVIKDENGSVIYSNSSLTNTSNNTVLYTFTTNVNIVEDQLIFALTDSYGDGWNGCKLNVSFSDGSASKSYTISSGTTATYNLNLARGVEATVKWEKGNYPGECSFVIKRADGTVLLNMTKGTLTNTETGTVLLTFKEELESYSSNGLAEGYYKLLNDGTWKVVVDRNESIKPCEGIMIKALNENPITIKNTVSTNVNASSNKFIKIAVSNNKYQDNAYISFNNGFGLDKINHQNENIPLLYIPSDSANYAVASMKMDFTETPVHFEAKTTGQYTISVSQENCDFDALFLYDKLTDVCVNILENDYSFSATTNDSNDRFILMTSNVKNINVTVNPEDAGVVYGADSCYFNETATLTATPNAGYAFANWTENDSIVSENAVYSFIVKHDRNLVANFELITYNITVTATPAEGGNVNVTGNFNYGNEAVITATTNEGYQFISWTENDTIVSTDTEYSFIVTSDRTFVANFELLTFNVTATANPAEGGEIDGTGVYNYGETATLTAIVNDGYAFNNWSINGEVVSTDSEYSFVVTEDVELYANYYSVQSRNLKSGWSWFSSYIEIDGEEGLETLENALGENGLQIKSQTAFVSNSTSGWYGSLTSVSVENMYMIQTSSAHDLTLVGNIINPENHPITVGTNWRWISYPVNESIDVEEALATIVPNHGDYIKSHTSFSQYYDGIGWIGALNTMNPGEGYMYQNTSGTTKTLVYPSSSSSKERKANVTSENNYWTPSVENYANNMNIIAVVNINDDMIMSDNYEIGVFAGDELCGSARPIYIEALDKYMIFLTVHGEGNEELTFKYYDADAEIERAVVPSDIVRFIANGTLGSLDNPFVLNCKTVGLDEYYTKQFNVYPNPTNRNTEINLYANYDRVEVYNSLGVKIAEYSNVDNIDGIETAGVYHIKAVKNNEVKYCRLIVK